MDQQTSSSPLGGVDTSKAGLKKLFFTFDGRVGRKEYWLLVVAAIAIGVVFGVVSALLGEHGGAVAGILALLLVIPYIWASIAIQIKRLHDHDKSGWFILINLVPYVGGIIMLVWLGFIPGTQGPNRFGAPRSGC